MAECSKLPICGFYHKYGSTREILCKGYLAIYCRGPKKDDCARKKYLAEHGNAPPDEMVPSGEVLKHFV